MKEPLNGRFLILDDDAAVGQTMQFIAEDAGMEARWISTPAELLEQIEQWRPTHIAVDLIMPEMDGVEVMRLLAERKCPAQIIISSGVGSRVLDAARRAATEHGLDMAGVLSKPFTPAALRGLLAAKAAVPADKRMEASNISLTADDLLRAIRERQLIVAYQPKVQCRNGELSGFEALVRWKHPQHGVLGPDRFIPIAEASGLIDQLTEQVFGIAMDWFAKTFHGSDLSLSLNVSAKSLGDFGLGDRFAGIGAAHDMEAGRIILELTESSAMEDPATSLALLTRLRMKGYELSIDDFGTGFSSMVQLVRLPFSEMKIDKSFVMSARQSEESRAVIKSIIDLGHGLKLKLTAEGVEDLETLLLLRDMGCDLAQGFFIAKPLYGDAVAEWMRGWEQKCRSFSQIAPGDFGREPKP